MELPKPVPLLSSRTTTIGELRDRKLIATERLPAGLGVRFDLRHTGR